MSWETCTGCDAEVIDHEADELGWIVSSDMNGNYYTCPVCYITELENKNDKLEKSIVLLKEENNQLRGALKLNLREILGGNPKDDQTGGLKPESKNARYIALESHIKVLCQDYQHQYTGEALWSAIQQQLEKVWDEGAESMSWYKMALEFVATEQGCCNCPIERGCLLGDKIGGLKCDKRLLAFAEGVTTQDAQVNGPEVKP